MYANAPVTVDNFTIWDGEKLSALVNFAPQQELCGTTVNYGGIFTILMSIFDLRRKALFKAA